MDRHGGFAGSIKIYLTIGCIVTGLLANANELQTKENGKHPCLYREGSKMYLPSLDLN